MIRQIKKQKKDASSLQLLWGMVVFFMISFLFFYSILNLCFQTLVKDPSHVFMGCCFAVLMADVVVGFYFHQWQIALCPVYDLIITVIMMLVWLVPAPAIQYVGVVIFLRFPEIIMMDGILRYRLNTRPLLIKILVIIKIFYMIMLAAHIAGCIFYLIDHSCIETQRFGQIGQNPTLYYEGSMDCFTPIYALQEQYRYVYAMYYSISLFSTVAYGDIIPKNPYENIYVMFLLFLVTIGVSIIIQEMIMFFRKEKYMLYTILKKVKYLYFHLLLEYHNEGIDINIPVVTRYIIYHLSYTQKRRPGLQKLTTQMQENIRRESVGGMLLPYLLTQYLVLNMNLVYLPAGYLMADNNDVYGESGMFVLMEGKVVMGYGEGMVDRVKVKKRGFLIGYAETILNCKAVHPYLRVLCDRPCMLLTISHGQIEKSLSEIRAGNVVSYDYIEYLQLERQKCLHFPEKTCHICSQPHYSYQCPSCHYTIDPLSHFYSQKQQRTKFSRGLRYKSTKALHNALPIPHQKVTQKLNPIVRSCRSMMDQFFLQLNLQESNKFQSVYNWQNYHRSFNI